MSQLPIPLNDDTRWILGRPNFWCASVAEVLRKDGHEINRKCEDEQAAVIHWLLCLYAEHGDKWAEAMHLEGRRIAENVKSKEAAS